MNAEAMKRLRTESKAGYRKDRFPADIRPEFLCKTCDGVVKRPKECIGCGLLMCEGCWEQRRRSTNPSSALFFFNSGWEFSCPNCVCAVTPREPSRILRRLILETKVKCKHYQLGCESVLSLADVKTHESGCAYKIVHCGNYLCEKTGQKAAFFPVFRPLKPGSLFVCSQICLQTVNMTFLLSQNEIEAAISEFYKATAGI